MTRIGPVARVRARLAGRLSSSELRAIPDGYQRLGSVVIVKLPETLRPKFPAIGGAYRQELGVASVLRRHGPIRGEFRLPNVERIAGERTETEVHENGVAYRFDAAGVMFASGNGIERIRIARAVRPGERVADLFAGIGYFTLPIAVHSRAEHVDACEANPGSFRYLRENIRRNHVEDRVAPHLGPNESAPLAAGTYDRVLLGFLPSALPWVDRATRLLRPEGGTLHLHQVVGTLEAIPTATSSARGAIEHAGAIVRSAVARAVKPYGPGKVHTVVDVEVLPSG
ncbi:MAG: class I SAM-dependent methyltransferase family protein [Thermoplasmata archaeon]|nr:class I SAM-dependent methyltransferase family protein [Thermoplasmata archaeon]MCI4354004.1 class I SAM-dependent methyltransferase family protein [Thermoplasmata archaeon]